MFLHERTLAPHEVHSRSIAKKIRLCFDIHRAHRLLDLITSVSLVVRIVHHAIEHFFGAADNLAACLPSVRKMYLTKQFWKICF